MGEGSPTRRQCSRVLLQVSVHWDSGQNSPGKRRKGRKQREGRREGKREGNKEIETTISLPRTETGHTIADDGRDLGPCSRILYNSKLVAGGGGGGFAPSNRAACCPDAFPEADPLVPRPGHARPPGTCSQTFCVMFDSRCHHCIDVTKPCRPQPHDSWSLAPSLPMLTVV